ILRCDAQKDQRDPSATSPTQLIREIRNVKRNVKVPVSTAEPWHVWLHYPELAKEVDYVAVHILPYWDEQSSETPLEYIKDKIGQLKKAPYLQNKNIIVTEVGWPSNGASRRSPGTGYVKHATPAEQAKNIRDMVAWLKSQNIDYFVVEAIDQPWKAYDLEGKAGGYWGLWDADRQQKFDWAGSVGTVWRRRWTREALPAAEMLARQPADRAWPKVSLHVAICNEPPAMVMQTLDSLAALDYPNFEVIVIDNNTKDPAVWRPVQDYCASLGERFKFFHFDVMKGFKAGALNYVLTQTAPDAKVIGVIDSDYKERPDWLKA